MNPDRAHNPGFSELKRIFGPEHVSEELRVPQSQTRLPAERWCYVVEVAPPADTSPLFSGNKNYSEAGNMGLNLELYLSNRLHVGGGTFENKAEFKQSEGWQPEGKPMIFVFPVKDMEAKERVAGLRRLSPEAISTAMLMPRQDHLREKHIAALRGSTHQLGWVFVSGQQGEFYQTMEPVRHPDALQMGLLSRLGLPDEGHFIPSAPEGNARVSLRAMLEGRLPSLMEGIVPETYCEKAGTGPAGPKR